MTSDIPLDSYCVLEERRNRLPHRRQPRHRLRHRRLHRQTPTKMV